MSELGGSLIQDRAIGFVTSGGDFTFVGEAVPATANVTAGRITTQLFGLGLVDAVPDEYLLGLARLEAAHSPATAGTPNMVREIRTGLTRVGRFGWKAQVPTLFNSRATRTSTRWGSRIPSSRTRTARKAIVRRWRTTRW